MWGRKSRCKKEKNKTEGQGGVVLKELSDDRPKSTESEEIAHWKNKMKSTGAIKVMEQNSKDLKNSWRENTSYLQKIQLHWELISHIKNEKLEIFGILSLSCLHYCQFRTVYLSKYLKWKLKICTSRFENEKNVIFKRQKSQETQVNFTVKIYEECTKGNQKRKVWIIGRISKEIGEKRKYQFFNSTMVQTLCY